MTSDIKPDHPGPLAPRDCEPAPWRRRDGIVKFLEFPVRRAGLSHRDFHLYWQRHHSPHVMNVTGFSRYMRKYVSAHGYEMPIAGLPERYRQTTPFDGASEVWINGLDDILAWLGHPLYPALIQPDEQRFLSQEGIGRVLVTRDERIAEVAMDAAESNLVRIYVMLQARAGIAREAFHSGISAEVRQLMDLPMGVIPCQITVNHRIDEPLPVELPPSGIDAVVSLDFRNLDELRRCLDGTAPESVWSTLEQTLVDSDHTRALVTRLHVVHDELSFQPTATQSAGFSWR